MIREWIGYHYLEPHYRHFCCCFVINTWPSNMSPHTRIRVKIAHTEEQKKTTTATRLIAWFYRFLRSHTVWMPDFIVCSIGQKKMSTEEEKKLFFFAGLLKWTKDRLRCLLEFYVSATKKKLSFLLFNWAEKSIFHWRYWFVCWYYNFAYKIPVCWLARTQNVHTKYKTHVTPRKIYYGSMMKGRAF